MFLTVIGTIRQIQKLEFKTIICSDIILNDWRF